MYNPLSLEGKRIMVTGASSGIGRACAEMISRLGGEVVLVARDEQRLRQTLESLDGSGHEVHRFDLSDSDATPAWMKQVTLSGKVLSGMVHCAGIEITLPIKTMKFADYRRLMSINLDAAYALSKGFRQRNVGSPASSIVFISSVAAIKAMPGMIAYATSKAALYGLTRSLAVELVRDGIRVNCVTPGLVETEMKIQMDRKRTPEQMQAVRASHLLGLGTTMDVAHAVVFLLAETGRWITGSNLVVDGGYSIN
ncbi:SDR family NAD(P)-dependent oxidoreductase [Candidatus Thiodictyon syntrophicum]|jgi:NAD(P)-dependent dehydrogenase (short-subunit alcohol dehydrogenase family)|uniref:Ketoreductase domain-containing protein n=1 Tax=Candidatus Thiodictyon syntrophicum TaxID=1166950 RepID=A0A2K8UD57_9GAMM|nr:SDR family oxidoreductase [Candidatus Thiodictyon syntrophicum]AUB83524.1 hypothetical protein THSYN_22955 [Candidatus Thiodictyon syntrophicum]